MGLLENWAWGPTSTMIVPYRTLHMSQPKCHDRVLASLSLC